MKADGCDLLSGLSESTRGIWSGDVDLNDGKLQDQYRKYSDRLSFIKKIGSGDHETKEALVEDMGLCTEEISDDITYIAKGVNVKSRFVKYFYSFFTYLELRQRNNEYCRKLEGRNASEKVLMNLAWDLKQLEELDAEGRKLKVTCQTIKEKVGDNLFDWVQSNMAGQLTSLRKELESYVRRVSRFRRTPATHILVVMISPQGRNRKPYAIPVQCIPYVGLRDLQLRSIIDKIIDQMTTRGMKVAGKYIGYCALTLS